MRNKGERRGSKRGSARQATVPASARVLEEKTPQLVTQSQLGEQQAALVCLCVWLVLAIQLTLPLERVSARAFATPGISPTKHRNKAERQRPRD